MPSTSKQAGKRPLTAESSSLEEEDVESGEESAEGGDEDDEEESDEEEGDDQEADDSDDEDDDWMFSLLFAISFSVGCLIPKTRICLSPPLGEDSLVVLFSLV